MWRLFCIVLDLVSYKLQYDPCTGKPEATSIVRKAKVSENEDVSPHRLFGTVYRVAPDDSVLSSLDDCGQIVFSYGGECYCLRYFLRDCSVERKLKVNDQVSFNIATNKGGNRAVNITVADPDSIQSLSTSLAANFNISLLSEKVSRETLRGTVLRPVSGDHIAKSAMRGVGTILCEPVVGSVNYYNFTCADSVGGFTIYPGDIVIFNVAGSRKNGTDRAINVQLLPETFACQNEQRYSGVVMGIRDNVCYVRCPQFSGNVIFRFHERMDVSWEPCVGDEIEFSLSTNEAKVAIRVRQIPPGTVSFDGAQTNKHQGIVIRAADFSNGIQGTISFETDNCCYKSVNFIGVPDSFEFAPGDSVEFEINCDWDSAINVKPIDSSVGRDRFKMGYFAVLKEGFGFIETAEHDCEIFFHFTSFSGDISKVNVGDEVQYLPVSKNGRLAAYCIDLVPKGTVNSEIVHDEIYDGEIIRPLRLVVPTQLEYSGLVRLIQKGAGDNHAQGKVAEEM